MPEEVFIKVTNLPPVMSRSRVKRPNASVTKCVSPAKKMKLIERSKDPLLNTDLSLPIGIKFSKKDCVNRFAPIELKSNRYLKEIKPILDRSFKEKSKQIFEPKECRDLVNADFESEYAAKRNEVRQKGMLSKDATADQYGFLFARKESQVRDWCERGIRSGNVVRSRLGKPEFGVNLQQCADVICPTHLLPSEGWICIVKYFKGCVYHVQETACPLEPQPNFDCHVPTAKSNSSWNRGNTDTFFSNQIYLYEYTDESIPTTRPRQVLPFAAVKYRLSRNPPKAHTVNRYSKLNQDKDEGKTLSKSNERLQLQRQREEERAAANKLSLPNRQHPGVPLMCVKPKPPPLISKTVRQLTSNSSNPCSAGGTSKITAPETVPEVAVKTVSDFNRRSSSENNVSINVAKAPKNKEPTIQITNTETNPENKKRKTVHFKNQTPAPEEKQQEERPHPVPNPPIRKAQPNPQPTNERPILQQRSDRHCKDIGNKHYSSGYIISYPKLKAGDHFQAQMHLVSYADTLIFPLAVLPLKLSIRKFASMVRLRTVELSGADISIKKEFYCPGCNRYATYYRLYIRSNNTVTDSVEIKKLCDYMRYRESVGIVHFPIESQEMLIFPDGDFSRAIGIQQVENASTDSPLFLHCLLLSLESKANYYQRLLYTSVDSDDHLLDTVLAAYIWADADMPPYNEEEAALRDSYGGEWPSKEAVEQVFIGENNIQQRQLFTILGRETAPIGYKKVDFYRPSESPLDTNVSVESVTTEMLQTWLDNVAAAQERQSAAQPEIEENGKKNQEVNSDVGSSQTGAQSQSTPPEPKPVSYAKRVFDEPPASPAKAIAVGPSERAVLVEMNPQSKDETNEKVGDTKRQALTSEVAANIQQIEKGIDQNAPSRGEIMSILTNSQIGVGSSDLMSSNANGVPRRSKDGSGQSGPPSDINEIFSFIRNSLLADNHRSSTYENGSVMDKLKETLNAVDDSETQAFNAYEMQNRAAQEAREMVQKPELNPPTNPSPNAPARQVGLLDEEESADLQWAYCPGTETSTNLHEEVTEEEIHQELDDSLRRRVSDDGSESPATLSSSPPRPFRRDHRFLRKSTVKQNSPSLSSDQELSPPSSPIKGSTCEVSVGQDTNRIPTLVGRRPSSNQQTGLYHSPFSISMATGGGTGTTEAHFVGDRN